MRKRAFGSCIPTASKKVPDRPNWIHEIKQDGYRLLVQRDHDQVKLITRNGHDWTKKYPRIVDAARKIRSAQFVLDGEACILGVDGVADFDDRGNVCRKTELRSCDFIRRRFLMRSLLVATAAITLICSPAFAQSSTGPAPQSDNMNKPGIASGTMAKGAKHKGTTGSAMKPDASTQGAGTAASVNAKGNSTEPGKVKDGATR